MDKPTVAQYALARLAQLGIDRIFGVPGDYAFAINDAAEQVLCFIEVMIPSEESQPLPGAAIDSGYKLRTPRAG